MQKYKVTPNGLSSKSHTPLDYKLLVIHLSVIMLSLLKSFIKVILLFSVIYFSICLAYFELYKNNEFDYQTNNFSSLAKVWVSQPIVDLLGNGMVSRSHDWSQVCSSRLEDNFCLPQDTSMIDISSWDKNAVQNVVFKNSWKNYFNREKAVPLFAALDQNVQWSITYCATRTEVISCYRSNILSSGDKAMLMYSDWDNIKVWGVDKNGKNIQLEFRGFAETKNIGNAILV